MKIRNSIVLLLSILLSISVSHAQDLGNLMQNYGKKDKFEVVNVNKTMLVAARAMADKEVREILKKVSHMKVMIAPDGSEAQNFVKDVMKVTKTQKYETLVEVREKGENTTIYYKELSPGKTELFLVNKDKNGSLNVLLVNGNLTLEEFEKMNKSNKK